MEQQKRQPIDTDITKQLPIMKILMPLLCAVAIFYLLEKGYGFGTWLRQTLSP